MTPPNSSFRFANPASRLSTEAHVKLSSKFHFLFPAAVLLLSLAPTTPAQDWFRAGTGPW